MLQARGELDEALRIRREQELPVYERLGDVRSVAVTHGKIADVLQDRGELDEALRIRREEELPVYERLGDVRSVRSGWARSPTCWRRAGNSAKRCASAANRHCPSTSASGDVREAAIAQAKIALILDGQGHRDDAIALLEAAQAQARRPGLAVAEQIGQLLDAARSRR